MTQHPLTGLASRNSLVKPTLGDDPLNAHHAAQQARGQCSRRHVFRPKAALQTHIEFFVLFGVSGVHRGNEVLEGSLKGNQLRKCTVHEPDRHKKRR